ncbi:MAG: hypothetical protein J7521_03340 [Caulobacter sp.]|nr:hypothetical protein [Caulobacter sp.]
MKIAGWTAVAAMGLVLSCAPPPRLEDAFYGAWTGVLDTPEPVEIELVISDRREARVHTRLVGWSRSFETLRPSVLRIEGESLHLRFLQPEGEFDGRLSLPGRIDGVWSQGARRMPVSLYRHER